MRLSLAPFVSLVLCLLVAVPLLAGEGRIPIWEPTTITEPGHYVVTRNIASDSPIITIGSSRVDIDLNGFELTGGTTTPVIMGATVLDVRIHDGSVVGGNPGIYFEVSGQITIENTVVNDSASIGMQFIESCGYIIRRCSIFADQHAIHAVAAYGCPGTIVENQIKGCGISTAITECVLVQGGEGSTVRDNRLVGHITGDGIRLVGSPASSVSGNYFSDIGMDTLDDAIVIQSSSTVSVKANTAGDEIVLEGSGYAIVSNNQVAAVKIDPNSHSNTILRNTVLGGEGVHVEGDRNRVEANVLNDTWGYGLYFASTAENNLYAGNVARGNSGSGCSGAGTSGFCDEGSGNTSHGDNYMPNQM